MFPELMAQLERINGGDEDALAKSGLKDVVIGKPKMFSTSLMNKELEQLRFSELKAAVEQLGMRMISDFCDVGIKMLGVMAKGYHNKNLEAITVKPEDYASTVRQFIAEFGKGVVRLSKPLQDAKRAEEQEEKIIVISDPDVEEDSDEAPSKGKGVCQKDKKGEDQIGSVLEESDKEPSKAKKGKGVSQKGKKGEDQIGSVLEESEVSEDESASMEEDNGSDEALSKGKRKRASVSGKGNKGKEESGTKKKRVHYSSSECPLCKQRVVNLRRHLKLVHVNKNEKIPLVRLEALVQAAKHGNKTVGGKLRQNTKDGEKLYKRKKEVCPLAKFRSITNIRSHCFWTFISENLRPPLLGLVPRLGCKLEKMTSDAQIIITISIENCMKSNKNFGLFLRQ